MREPLRWQAQAFASFIASLNIDLPNAIFYRSGVRMRIDHQTKLQKDGVRMRIDHQTKLQKDGVVVVPKAWITVKLTE